MTNDLEFLFPVLIVNLFMFFEEMSIYILVINFKTYFQIWMNLKDKELEVSNVEGKRAVFF
jgi:hypothetical protein